MNPPDTPSPDAGNAPPDLQPYLMLADAVIITDVNHRILAVNQAYEKITGYESSKIIGLKAGILRTNDTPRETFDSMKRAIHAERAWCGVLTNRRSGGELWHSSITITPFRLQDAVYFVGVFRDLEQLRTGRYLDEERLVSIQDSLLKVLAISCEIRDPGIEPHLLRVRELTELLVHHHNERAKLKLSPSRLRQISHASILHDIGKSGIPEGILYKPGPLADYERRIVEMHTQIGADLLDKISQDLNDQLFTSELSVARHIILHHHEKWDGSGYPHRLAGEKIPLEARIVAIVDVFDALTSKRPYKERWETARAAAYIHEQRGRHFDPAIVDSFLELLSDPKFEQILSAVS